MILLDTNVLSEGANPKPSESVLRWLDAQDALSIFTTSISQAEMLYGIERLPAGKRQLRLSAAATKMFEEDFDGRILPFDRDAATWYARLVAARESAGRPTSQFDAMIAAIA